MRFDTRRPELLPGACCYPLWISDNFGLLAFLLWDSLWIDSIVLSVIYDHSCLWIACSFFVRLLLAWFFLILIFESTDQSYAQQSTLTSAHYYACSLLCYFWSLCRSSDNSTITTRNAYDSSTVDADACCSCIITNPASCLWWRSTGFRASKTGCCWSYSTHGCSSSADCKLQRSTTSTATVPTSVICGYVTIIELETMSLTLGWTELKWKFRTVAKWFFKFSLVVCSCMASRFNDGTC